MIGGNELFELVKKLTNSFGVSGNEEEIREVIKTEVEGFVDNIYVDALGNLIAVKKGKKEGADSKKIMLAAHMDEIGIIVNHIDENGFIRFSNIGWVSQYFSLGQRVRFRNGTTGAVFYEEKLEEMKDLKLSKMYIDIGVKSREEAEEKLRVGDVAGFVGDAVQEGSRIISKSLDNRCGCSVLVKLIKEMPETVNEVYFVFTVQEEVGLRGAKTSAYGIMPDFAIGIDVTDTGDTPQCKLMEVKCGGGAAIKIKDNSFIAHPMVKNLLEDSAKRIGIPYQLEILEAGGTDPGAIHLIGGGIPSGAISIPCRYIHSPVEMVDINDLEGAVKLLKACI